MVSYGPDSQSLNYTHMSSFVDYRGKTVQPCITKGSIYEYIYKNNNMTRIKQIIDHAKFIGQLNDEQADFTCFFPTDQFINEHFNHNYFDDMDDSLARGILNCSMVNRKIDRKLIMSSPVAYYITKNPQMRMYTTNINNQTILNNRAKIITYDLKFNNGIIHIIDNLLIPTDETFMN